MLHLTCWHLLLDSSHQFILIVDILNKKDEPIGYGKVSWELKELSHGGPTYFLVNLPPLSYSMNFMPIKYGRKKNNINSLFIFVTLISLYWVIEGIGMLNIFSLKIRINLIFLRI